MKSVLLALANCCCTLLCIGFVSISWVSTASAQYPTSERKGNVQTLDEYASERERRPGTRLELPLAIIERAIRSEQTRRQADAACRRRYGAGAVSRPDNPRRCACRGGYRWSRSGRRRRCVRIVEAPRCGSNAHYSRRLKRCVCDSGFTWRNGRCRTIVTERAPERGEELADVALIQECLSKLGYDPGSIDGVAGPQTRRAFREFQIANALGRQPSALTDRPSQRKLFAECEKTEVAKTERETEVAAVAARQVRPAAQRCVPQDIYNLLVDTYGPRPGLKVCGKQMCMPAPAFLTTARRKELKARGITWCDTQCLQLGSYLPLADIERIEAAASIALCGTVPLLQCAPVSSSQTITKVRTIFRRLPVTQPKEGDIAVLIGNKALR